MRGKSIITDDMDHCFCCGRPADQIHHCIYGSRRKLADEDGLVVPVCILCHDQIHNGDGKLAMYLRQIAQKEYESRYGHDAWMQRYGKNYL